jgi:hypothetical protein
MHWPCRIGVGTCDTGRRREGGGTGGKLEEAAAREDHGVSIFSFFVIFSLRHCPRKRAIQYLRAFDGSSGVPMRRGILDRPLSRTMTVVFI